MSYSTPPRAPPSSPIPYATGIDANHWWWWWSDAGWIFFGVEDPISALRCTPSLNATCVRRTERGWEETTEVLFWPTAKRRPRPAGKGGAKERSRVVRTGGGKGRDGRT